MLSLTRVPMMATRVLLSTRSSILRSISTSSNASSSQLPYNRVGMFANHSLISRTASSSFSLSSSSSNHRYASSSIGAYRYYSTASTDGGDNNDTTNNNTSNNNNNNNNNNDNNDNNNNDNNNNNTEITTSDSDNNNNNNNNNNTDVDVNADADVDVDADADDDQPNAPRGTNMLPREVVSELNRFIVGQDEAKRAVAVALRNRWRRRQLDGPLRDEIMPKNILMIGPTGVGKTEVARRLANLCGAPFLKVEATKFTEVGFHGRDVDQILRDLVDVGIQQTKTLIQKKSEKQIDKNVEERLLELLAGEDCRPSTKEAFRNLLRKGELDGNEVEIVVQSEGHQKFHGGGNEQRELQDFFRMLQRSTPKRMKMTIREAIPYLRKQEGEKLVSMDVVVKEAIDAVEQDGIVFIDEIDKICTPKDTFHRSADASAEGVQRDLLPLIEGSIVSTKYGNVNTAKILFIASGAFYSCKPSDLLPELQGRLPIRVELKALNKNDLYRILTEPEMNLVRQQTALLKTESIDLEFEEDAIREIAKIAAEVNETVENIGARRLHTVIERIMEDISFNCDQHKESKVLVTVDNVREKLRPLQVKTDLSRFVL